MKINPTNNALTIYVPARFRRSDFLTRLACEAQKMNVSESLYILESVEARLNGHLANKTAPRTKDNRKET